jgi:hypothetical protein
MYVANLPIGRPTLPVAYLLAFRYGAVAYDDRVGTSLGTAAPRR